MATSGQPDRAFGAPVTERMIAVVIDLVIVAGLCFFPRIGWMFGIIYHLTRDSLPFLKGQSFGKYLMKIKVITNPGNESLMSYPEKSVIRGLVMLIPVLNVIDVWYLMMRGYRLADLWAQTMVVYSDDLDDDEVSE